MRRHSGGVGRPVLVVYSGSNPSASAVTIKKAGTNTTDTIATGEQLVLTSWEFFAETGGVCLVSGGTGCNIVSVKLPTTGGGIAQTSVERRCVKSTAPTVTAAAGGVVDLIASGTIIAAP